MPSSHLARRVLAIVSLAVAPCLSSRSLFALEESNAPPTKLERVRVSDDGKRFELVPSGKPFTPIGFNYDHDEKSQLIEEYWEEEWERVVEDFHEMKRLGANVVRIHLQFDQFMTKADEANEKALERLRRLLELAEKVGIYLDITGLGSYVKEHVPAWYDELSETERWNAQAKFWEAVAAVGRKSPAVFCYDIMNEPVVPGGPRKLDGWLGGQPLGRFYFVQFITRELGDRKRPDVARAWTRHLAEAIRRQDPDHLVTVGLVPWSLDRPGLTSGFVPSTIAPEVDFIAVHVYPERGKVDEALDTLRGFAVGKPVVIEETFPLKCGSEEHLEFLRRSREIAAGWIGFYWGATPDEYREMKDLRGALILGWLDTFDTFAKELREQEAGDRDPEAGTKSAAPAETPGE